jgi:hypothetical protein
MRPTGPASSLLSKPSGKGMIPAPGAKPLGTPSAGLRIRPDSDKSLGNMDVVHMTVPQQFKLAGCRYLINPCSDPRSVGFHAVTPFIFIALLAQVRNGLRLDGLRSRPYLDGRGRDQHNEVGYTGSLFPSTPPGYCKSLPVNSRTVEPEPVLSSVIVRRERRNTVPFPFPSSFGLLAHVDLGTLATQTHGRVNSCPRIGQLACSPEGFSHGHSLELYNYCHAYICIGLS